MNRQPIRSVAVLGGEIVGLSAALAFRRALPDVAMSIVPAPADPAALADRLTGTLPSTHRFHAAIGVAEEELIRRGAAIHRLATRFSGWPGAAPWFHVHGTHGQRIGGASFHTLWARARREGRALAYHRYAPAGVIAEADKFVLPADDPRSPLSTYDHALKLHPARYHEVLAAKAAALAIPVLPDMRAVETSDRGVAALILADGARLEADLFIDAAGPRATLLSRLDPRFDSWAAWLPIDRLALEQQPVSPRPTPIDRVDAGRRSWRGLARLDDMSVATIAYRSEMPPEDLPAGEPVPIAPGARPAPWTGNVLAIGDAAVALDPLYGVNLALAQSAILRALALLPGRDMHPLELAEYNRRTADEVAGVRDFMALHYLHAPFASDLGPPPDSLTEALSLWRRRGALPPREEELLERDAWIAALAGLGDVPRATDPITAGVPADLAAATIARLAAELATIPPRLPPYAEYLARLRR